MKLLPVKGTVTLDGQPLPAADVVFFAGDPPLAFAGQTKADGSYELQGLAGKEAALQGVCKVTVSRMVKPDGSPVSPEETPVESGAVEQLPPKYTGYATTMLTATVAPGGATCDFALTSR
ncbi:MAG TPA: hypothetical protein VFI31_04265 [Pirellulales bacterium]|nr:hypothetical protein [Pirellulales bacterium]